MRQFRDLRSKAGTDKADATDMREAQRQLGHKSVKTTEIYLRARAGQISHADQMICRTANLISSPCQTAVALDRPRSTLSRPSSLSKATLRSD